MKTEKEVRHTPIPYYATNVDSEYVIQSAKINEDNYVGKCDYPEDAAFIVKCCNSHYELLEACKDVINNLTLMAHANPKQNYFLQSNINILKQAILKAEGKE